VIDDKAFPADSTVSVGLMVYMAIAARFYGKSMERYPQAFWLTGRFECQ